MGQDNAGTVRDASITRSQLVQDVATGKVTLGHPNPDVQAVLEAALARDPELIAAALTAGSGASAGRPVGKRWLSTEEAAKYLGISRWTLDIMVARAPKNLPGTPEHIGSGRQRRHLRWNADKLDEWLGAYRGWEMSRGRRPK